MCFDLEYFWQFQRKSLDFFLVQCVKLVKGWHYIEFKDFPHDMFETVQSCDSWGSLLLIFNELEWEVKYFVLVLKDLN